MRAALLVAACGDNEGPDVHIIEAPDAGVDAPADACTRTPTTDGCCAALPDLGAAQTCANDTADPGICGEIICWRADCSLVRISFCTEET